MSDININIPQVDFSTTGERFSESSRRVQASSQSVAQKARSLSKPDSTLKSMDAADLDSTSYLRRNLDMQDLFDSVQTGLSLELDAGASLSATPDELDQAFGDFSSPDSFSRDHRIHAGGLADIKYTHSSGFYGGLRFDLSASVHTSGTQTFQSLAEFNQATLNLQTQYDELNQDLNVLKGGFQHLPQLQRLEELSQELKDIHSMKDIGLDDLAKISEAQNLIKDLGKELKPLKNSFAEINRILDASQESLQYLKGPKELGVGGAVRGALELYAGWRKRYALNKKTGLTLNAESGLVVPLPVKQQASDNLGVELKSSMVKVSTQANMSVKNLKQVQEQIDSLQSSLSQLNERLKSLGHGIKDVDFDMSQFNDFLQETSGLFEGIDNPLNHLNTVELEDFLSQLEQEVGRSIKAPNSFDPEQLGQFFHQIGQELGQSITLPASVKLEPLKNFFFEMENNLNTARASFEQLDFSQINVSLNEIGDLLEQANQAGLELSDDLDQLATALDNVDIQSSLGFNVTQATGPGLRLGQVGATLDYKANRWLDGFVTTQLYNPVVYLPGEEVQGHFEYDENNETKAIIDSRKKRNVGYDFYDPAIGIGVGLTFNRSEAYRTDVFGGVEKSLTSDTLRASSFIRQHIGNYKLSAGILNPDIEDDTQEDLYMLGVSYGSYFRLNIATDSNKDPKNTQVNAEFRYPLK